MQLDDKVCFQAMVSKDPRFDGRFFVGVTTTGVYCRPICPAPKPRAENARYYPSAAAAGEAGFRPCLRCRPEASPRTPAWAGTKATVSRALRLIDSGALDEGDTESLAQRLGVGQRHLRRLFRRHVGASPAAVAHTRRLHFAKSLLDETDLPMAQVALTAGFGSVRRFNEVFQRSYGRRPSDLRRSARRRPAPATGPGVILDLRYRPPYDWDSIFQFLAHRAIPRVEEVDGGTYRRAIALGSGHGVVEVSHRPERNALEVRVDCAQPAALLPVVERVRRVFDLAADPEAITTSLGGDPLVGPLVRAHPGLRVPGAWDGFELAVRAILGQQVSVKGARTMAGRLVERCGPKIEGPDAGPRRLFPSPGLLLRAELSGIGLTSARIRAIRALATAVDEGELTLAPHADADTERRRLIDLPGIGAWTAEYVAMRALAEPDAFPSSDLGLLRGAANGAGRPSPRQLERQSEAWRPWRAYAALYLWKRDSALAAEAR